MSGHGFRRRHSPNTNSIENFPEELLLSILELLDHRDLAAVNRTNSWLYSITLPLIWKNIELVDTRTKHGHLTDDHDDTPILRLLLTFVKKPWIATCVQVLTHRCHINPPCILEPLEGLSQTPFCSHTLSTDPRTIWLVRKAVDNLNHVHTLRIIFGHPTINDALLRCFFDAHRPRRSNYSGPVRRLWLESCRISAGLALEVNDFPYELPSKVSFDGLESVRFRRLPIDFKLWHFNNARGVQEFVHSRGYRPGSVQLDPDCSRRYTWNKPFNEWYQIVKHMLEPEASQSSRAQSPLSSLLSRAQLWDDLIYGCLAVDHDLPAEVIELGAMNYEERSRQQFCGQLSWWPSPTSEHMDTLWAVRSQFVKLETEDDGDEMAILDALPWQKTQREQIPGTHAAIQMLRSANRTLTSLNLDWVLTCFPEATDTEYHALYRDLFKCRFPNLKAFQMRNCVVQETKLPSDIYLFSPLNSELGPGGLEFMEAHSNLRCLAWPIEHFFPHQAPSPSLGARIDSIISNLGRSLVDLRVDADYSRHGEPCSESTACSRPEARLSRIRFITHFAAQMTTLASIKLEGGMPLDERREVLRALHRCPLQKIVLIGVTCPIGNFWGPYRNVPYTPGIYQDLEEEEDIFTSMTHSMEARNLNPPQASADFIFSPQFGWAGSRPLLSTLLFFFQDTITELKFCGFHRAPTLFRSGLNVAAERFFFEPLKHFHRIESLIVSFWLTTLFEGHNRDLQVMEFWRNSQSPSSTALVIRDEPAEGEMNGWARELKTKFAPEALVKEIVRVLGPKVSEKAKAREGGLHIRASFALGHSSDVFDVDLQLGKDDMGHDVVLEWTPPLEGTDPERRRDKLEKRRWF